MSAKETTRGNAEERLQKVLAHAGVASRRRCEEYIQAGRIKVNGEVVTQLGVKVRPAVDRIEVDGKPVVVPTEHRYYLLYKPVGHVTTASDPQGRPTALDLVPGADRLYPVGRLDMYSEGLLLCTNDGALANRLIHPRYEHEKEYLVLVRGGLTRDDISVLQRGLVLPDEERPARASIRMMPRGWRWRGDPLPRGCQWVRIILREGRKRQIRRMLGEVHCSVERLVRVRMGPLTLGELQPAQGRRLRPSEVSDLQRSVGLGAGWPRRRGSPSAAKRWERRQR